MRVSVEIDTDDVLEECSTYDLVAELIIRQDWKQNLEAALNARKIMGAIDLEESFAIDDLLRDWSMGFPVNEQLSALCRQRLGLTIPVRN